ncbi:hypothetical protein NPRO_07850 [Candidatus Nitrosymbiomonas proteolyticus]|uniref:Uncharacterized protein n=1 Tax=Candidatus Nitrosymbiomonas proteolyticus TaxID=2608984 RepID=A0A809R6L5_9BACT|nr:hypothetical protein NPRO_07850 [Candidatus Nitrosymbiomonas proteolyticus]
MVTYSHSRSKHQCGRVNGMQGSQKAGSSVARDLVGGIVGALIGFGLMRLGQSRIADLAAEQAPGFGSTRRVDETPMMQILIWLGVALIVIGIAYVLKGLIRASKRTD